MGLGGLAPRPPLQMFTPLSSAEDAVYAAEWGSAGNQTSPRPQPAPVTWICLFSARIPVSRPFWCQQRSQSLS